MAENRVCPSCGMSVVSDGSDARIFCSNCGQKLIVPAVVPTRKKFVLFNAIKSFFKGYVDFKGRSSRSEYWYMYLVNVIIVTALYLLMMPAIVEIGKYSEPSPLSLILMIIAYMLLLTYWMGTLVPWIAITIRRLHDAGLNGMLCLLMLVPCVGSIIIFVFTLFDSQSGDNAYGPNPKFKQ